MNIEKVECWKEVGYTEESLDVSWYPLNKAPDLEFNEVYPSPNRLFNEFHINAKYDICRNIKYIRIKFKDLETIYYGWVDNVTLATVKLTLISWHVDYWRTYIRDAKFKKVWLKRRPYKYGDVVPYPKVPIRYQMSGLEDIKLCGQRDGIYWVILIYLAGKTSLFDALKGVFPSVIMSHAHRIFEGWEQEIGDIPGRYHIEQFSDFMWGIGKRKFREIQRDVARFGNKIPMFCNLNEHMRCCTFPVLSDSIANAYFRDMVYDYTKKGWSPSLEQLLNGSITNGLGLSADHFVGGFISPVCPLRHVQGDGRWIIDPIIVSQDNATEIPVHPNESAFTDFEMTKVGDVEAVYTFPSGVHAVGEFKKGCPILANLFDTYYAYNRGLAGVDPEGHLVEPWRKVDGSGYALEIDDSEYPILDCLDPDAVRKCKYVRLSDFLKALPYGQSFTRLNFTDSVTDQNVYYSSDEGHWISVKMDDKTTRWRFVPPTSFETISKRFLDLGILINGICRFHGNEWVVDFYIFQPPVRPMNPRQIWLPMSTSDKVRTLKAYHDDRSSFCYIFGFNLDKKHYDATTYMGIENYTAIWPVIFNELPYEVWGDESRDLVLVGPDSQIIHTFRKHVRYKKYCHEITMGTGSAYLKITFFSSDYSNLNPAINEEVAVFSLPPLPIFTSKTNEYEITGQKAADLATLALQDKDRKDAVNRKDQSNALSTVIAGGLGAATSIMMGGGLGGAVTTMALGAGRSLADKYMGLKEANAATQTAERMQKIKEDQMGAAGLQMMGNGTLSCIHTFRGVTLGYIHKDEYSMMRFYEAISKTGVDVSEYREELTLTRGPYQFDEAAVEGNIPREAAVYIANRLKHGVYLNDNL